MGSISSEMATGKENIAKLSATGTYAKKRARKEPVAGKTAFLVILASLALIALVFYKDIFGYSFVGSDTLSLIDTGRIHGLHDVVRIFGKYTMAGTGFDVAVAYRPVSVLSYSLDYALWGLNPFGYHLTDFLLHLSAVFLVVYVVFILSRSRTASILSGLVFTVHPIVLESLAASSRRQTILPAIFMLIAFLFFIKYVDASPHRKRYLVPSLVSYLLALGSEEIAFALPALLIAYLAIFSAGKVCKRDVLAILKTCAPYLVATGIFLVWRTMVLHGMGGYHWGVHLPENNVEAFSKISSMYFSDLLYPGDILGWLFRPFSLYSWKTLVYLFLGSATLSLFFYAWRLFKNWETWNRKERNAAYSVYFTITLLFFGLIFASGPIMNSFFNQSVKQSLRSLIPLLIVVCGLILIAFDQRRKLINYYRYSIYGKLVLFAVIWLVVPLLIYLPTLTFAHRNAYFPLVPFSILVSVFLLESQKAAKSAVQSWSSRRRTRNAARIVAFLLAAALALSFPLSTYLINRAGEWKTDSDFTGLLLTRIKENVNKFPAGSEVEFYNLPVGISNFEGQYIHAKEISYPEYYSIKSWMDLIRPDNHINVIRREWASLKAGPADLNLRIEQIGEKKFKVK